MNSQKPSKLNRLLQKWPKGTVATTRWLQKNGISRNLTTTYEKSGWVQRIGAGAVIRCGDRVGWQGAVYALQKQLGLGVHPGAKTALALHGSAHNIPMRARQRVVLLTQPGQHLPVWFTSWAWDAEVEVVRADLFGDSPDAGMSKLTHGDFEILVSSRERAMLEQLFAMKGDGQLEEVWNIMQGLVTLRPAVVQSLLEKCSSIKAKRLFLVIAEETEQPWLSRVNLSDVDFGRGKRVFAPHGYLHPHYSITVPRSWRRGKESP